jgi:hypothetical protein
MDLDDLFVLRRLLGLDRPNSNCHFCTARFSIYTWINRKHPELLYITFWRHLLCHDLGIHHQAKHCYVTVSALLAMWQLLLSITDSTCIQTSFLSFCTPHPTMCWIWLIFPIPNWNPLLKTHACQFAPWKNRHCMSFFNP